MQSNKYFLAVIFLAGALFFSTNHAQALCIRNANSAGIVGRCCDETLNQADCAALPAETGNWEYSADCAYQSCGFSAPTMPSTVNAPVSSASSATPTVSRPLMPAHTPTTTNATTENNPTTFVNPLGSITTVSALVINLLNNLKAVIVVITVLVIAIGGLMYILSAGDEKKITTAKSIVTAAVIGLAIVLAAPTFLVEIERILGGGNGVDNSVLSGALSLTDIVTRTLNLLLSIVGILAIIGLVIGGSFYLTAYGDEKRIETGKKIITSSLIGIAIVMGALVIVKQVAALFGVN